MKVLVPSSDIDALGSIRPERVNFAWRAGGFYKAATSLIETLFQLYEGSGRDGRPFREMLAIYDHTDEDYLPTSVTLDQKLQWLFNAAFRRTWAQPRVTEAFETNLCNVFGHNTEAGRARGQLSHLRVAGPARTSSSAERDYCRED